VTAVHGKVPMNVPNMQSQSGTAQTPQAMLMPDHGTIPMSRRIERRTQAGDVDLDVATSGSPSKVVRVNSTARGKKWDKSGARGVARRVAQADPSVVRVVRSSVARAGEKRAPARTF
jgi:hypothetical protein